MRGLRHQWVAFTSSVRSFSVSGAYRDSYDYTRLLQHCRSANNVKLVHAQIITGGFEQNPFVGTKLVGKYTELGGSHVGYARQVFDRLSERDVFLWNVIIQGYANLDAFVEESVHVYGDMRLRGVSANQYTYTYVLKACGAVNDGWKGQVIHGQVVKSGLEFNLFVGNALVAYYAKRRDLVRSRELFDGMPQKDIVSWNSMISGYAGNGFANESLDLFHALLGDGAGIAPDNATLVAVLPACAQAAALQEGMWIHSYAIKSGMGVDAALGSGLISTYANCGRLGTARDVFDRISNKNVMVWNAMMRCYGMHGQADEAFNLFSQMLGTGLHPDNIMFLCLLSACSHAGMVAKGWELFDRMVDYGVERNNRHYACMVDLLGRAGLVDEAAEFMHTMPLHAGKDAYGALLGACRKHNRLELAEEVAKKLFHMDPENAGRYIVLAKMYEDADKWEDAARVRKMLKDKGIRKQLGSSSIEVDGILRTFGAEDKGHPQEAIFDTSQWLNKAVEVLPVNSHEICYNAKSYVV